MNNERYETCNNCNRSFFQGRLKMHQMSCKTGKPFKTLKKSLNEASPQLTT